MMHKLSLIFLWLAIVVSAHGQQNNPNTWFNADQEWYQIAVKNDAVSLTAIRANHYDYIVYELDIADLITSGFPDNAVVESQLKLFLRGNEIPIEIERNTVGENLQQGDKIRFVGNRNTGKNEKWAYGSNGNDQANDYYSLYSDSTIYWLTWSGSPGKRYQTIQNASTGTYFAGFRDSVIKEIEATSYYPGYDTGAELSTFGESEGYYWYDGNLADEPIKNIIIEASIEDIVRVDSAIYIDSRVASQSIGIRSLSIDLLHAVNGSIAYHSIGNVTWSGKGGRIVSGSVSPVRLIDYTSLDLHFKLTNENTGASASNPHLFLFDWYKYSYYRGFTVNTNYKQFSFWKKPDGLSSIRFRNIALGSTVRVFQPNRQKIFTGIEEPDIESVSFFDDQSSSQNELYIAVKNNEYAQVHSIRKYSLPTTVLAASNEADVIILTRSVLKNHAQIYANYRASKSNVKTKVVLAEELWNLFGYGIRTPKAIQDFIHYARRTWQIPPESVFIIADASFQNRDSYIALHEIPSFGYPSSDVWYGMNQTSSTDWIPRVSVGRLTVKSTSEIIAYLSKVSQYESNRPEYESWQKRVTLLSGGLEATEREQLLQHNLKLGALASNSIIAADTVIIGKQSNQPLDESARGDLSEIINSGTFILQFYGHSSPDSWDLLTDNPDAYQNQGKSAIVLSLGCYSGLFTTASSRVISEQFVFAPNAAVAFIGGSGQGIPTALENYSEYFYRAIFNDTLPTLGEVDQLSRINMIRKFLNISTADLALIQNTNIIGDPSLQLAYPRKPDYRFDFDPYRIEPNPTNISDSTFNLVARVRNMGTLPTGSVDLSIVQNRPSLSPKNYSITVAPVKTVKEIPIAVKLDDADAGIHEFMLTIDSEQALTEYDEFNNRLQVEHQVFSTGADLIYPLNNSLHNSKTPLFVVSSPTIFNREIINIELDTLPDFTSPIANTSIQGTDLNVEWQPSIQLKHLKEYYWRAKVEREGEENWRRASFIVDTTITGTWWQQTQSQFENNRFSSSLIYDDQKEYSFNTVNLEIRTSTVSKSFADMTGTEYATFPASAFVNGEQMGRLKISFFMIVINGLTGEIRNGIDSQGIPRGTGYAIHGGLYRTPGDGLLSRTQFIQDLNNVRVGDYVIIRIRTHGLTSPVTEIFTGNTDPLVVALRSVGAFKATGGVDGTQTVQLTKTDGYILFGKKFRNQSEYDPSQVSEYIVKNGVMYADTVLSFNTSEGTMTSPLIGPVKSWKKIEGLGNRVSATGKIYVDVYGQASVSSNPVRLTTANPNGLLNSFSADLSVINTNDYPYVRLVARLENEDRKAPQFYQWKVQYEPMPELAIDPFSVQVNTDSLEEGYLYNLSINVQNLGLIDSDSVIVSFYDVYKPTNATVNPVLIKSEVVKGLESFRKVKVPPPITAKKLSVTIPTIDKQGNHSIQVRFTGNHNDQLTYNNFFSRDFYVEKDSIAPNVEVFFDNRFIAPITNPITDKTNPNLSFVSSKPVIDIYWKDSNPYLRINDSTDIEIRLFTTDPNNYVSYSYLSPEVEFKPASDSGTKNEAYVQFTPDFSAFSDTALTLQVYSRDKTGNVAEDKQDGYMVSFRVSNEGGISSFYPYPNPMSNFTNFAFELKGADVSGVEKLQLKIFTLTGRPV
ncbi:hypothetical protein EP331_04435, partial [bacterium]